MIRRRPFGLRWDFVPFTRLQLSDTRAKLAEFLRRR